MLGKYRNSGPEDNTRYPDIEKYLQNAERKISKLQARDIMSLTNTLKEVTFDVQSTKFINDCDSFDKMKSLRLDVNLFKMTQNAQFVALSKLCNGDVLNVNWSGDRGVGTDVKGWMFEQNPDNCSDENMLKAFVRTQIYRPLFFQYNNYKKFSSKESVYYCLTEKHFIDHVGNEHKVLFTNWPDEETLYISKDGAGDPDGIKDILESDEISHGEYTVPADSIKYFPIPNKFEYSINYNPVRIIDNKFVINDVEYYVVRPDGGENTYINSIYFNEFQSNTEGQNQVAQITKETIDDNTIYKFKLNGLVYVIEGNEISIDDATEVFDENATPAEVSNKDKGRYKEWLS